MNEPNASHTYKAKSRTKAKEPVDGDLVLDIKFVLLTCAIMPYAHDSHENEGKSNRNPCSLEELD